MSSKRQDRLKEYRKKRSADRTIEPYGSVAERPGLFVVQLHSASHLHFDFRFEVDGVLRSWAVPKGPSLDPNEKRLAIATEDHPVEYADFEGTIPAGNYGAGTVVVWDQGRTIHHIPPDEAERDGKYLFELFGYKLRGLFTLVKTKRSDKQWLLIKKPDAGASETVLPTNLSVLSGLSIDQVADGVTRARELASRLAEFNLPRRTLDPTTTQPMLAKLERQPFDRQAWLFEIKYDGYRLLAGKSSASSRRLAVSPGPLGLERSRPKLAYRSGHEVTETFPEIYRALRALPFRSLLLDGEVTVLETNGHASFRRLQKRAMLTQRLDVERAALESPATFFAFDLLELEGFDLRSLPLSLRKQLLLEVVPTLGPIRFTEHVEHRGRDFFKAAKKLGLEGVVAKRANAPYVGRRNGDWIKLRVQKQTDFVIVGYSYSGSNASELSSVHVAVFVDGRLSYAGRVGTGFTLKQRRDLKFLLDTQLIDEPAFEGSAHAPRKSYWVAPQTVATVRYTEFTAAGHLRHPVFVRLRSDRDPVHCVRLPKEATLAEPTESLRSAQPRVQVTRPGKIFWPDQGYTKGDLVAYYRSISKWLLPYLKDRPVVLDRYPDGIEGKSFFQKNAPEFAPDWVRREAVYESDEDRPARLFVCDDETTLIYLINSGAIPLHLWASRLSSLQNPDWAILDLDAKQATFSHVISVARSIRKLCRSIGMPSFVKTSGATGLHILLPLDGRCSFEQARLLAELIARIVAVELPDIASVARLPRSREGKVYIDSLQNGYGKLLVSPFSVRPLPGATVSTPLGWSEVRQKMDKQKYHLRSVPRRLKRMKRDPMAPLLSTTVDLAGVLEALDRRLARSS